MRPKAGSVELEVARIAAGQHGVVTMRQLLVAGMSRTGVRRRVEKGLLHRQHRGVFRVGHRAPSTEADYLAAVLACGERAILSGWAAAFIYGLFKRAAPRPEVTTPTDRRIPGVLTHRNRHLHVDAATTYRGIPITAVPRTVVDLAATLSLDALARACHEAQVRHRITGPMVDAVLARRPNVTGAGKLREIFHGEVRTTLSKLERDFLSVLQAAGLPLPQTNRLAGGRYVDCRWPEHQVTVELDSYRYHHTRHAWNQDRRRAREARARGDEFRRYTYGDLTEDRSLMLAELRKLLGP